MKFKKEKQKKQRKITIITFLQSLYLTNSFCLSNDIFSYAASSAFSFLFSFIPVVLLILAILIRILHASPDTVLSIIQNAHIFSDTFDLERALNQVTSVTSVTLFEVVLVGSIIWMGRRFFASVMQNMFVIFRQQRKSQPLAKQIVIFVGEFIIILFAATLIFAIISFKAAKNSGMIQKYFPMFPVNLTTQLLNYLPHVCIFFAIMICFRMESGTKPAWFKCAIASFGCTFSFWVFQRLMGLFINVSRYNLIYGILSNVIVLLMEAYIFFQLFFFAAQYLYVSQFFDQLLLAELYLLPDETQTDFMSKLKRKLFIRPDYIIASKDKTMHYTSGEIIYSKDEMGTDAYYITKGSVMIRHNTKDEYLTRGAFFGEEACMIEEGRNETVVALEDTELAVIPKETFRSLLDKNPMVTKEALAHISSYFAAVYGRTDKIRL